MDKIDEREGNEIRCLIQADYDPITGKLRRAAHLRTSYPPQRVRYILPSKVNYPKRLGHYTADPLSIPHLIARFFSEPKDTIEADLEHVFFLKRATCRFPVVFENDQSPGQFLEGYLGFKGRIKKQMIKLFTSLSNMERSKAVIVWSEWAKRGFVDDGFSDDLLHIIPPPIPLPAERADLSSKNLLFIGRDYSRKGGELAIRAFLSLCKRYEDMKMTYVGKIDDIALKREAESTKRFEHHENPSDTELFRHIYPSASIFVLPTKREAFGISILEAMSFGLPVIATRLPAIQELVKEDFNGFTVEGGYEEFKERIEVLLSSERLRSKMGDNARSFVKIEFDPTKIANMVKAVYYSVL